MALTQISAGWQDIPNSAPMLGNDQIGDAARYAEKIGTMVADAPGDLPASGNWPGRRIYVISWGRPATWTGNAWVLEPMEADLPLPPAASGWTFGADTLFSVTGRRVRGSVLISRNVAIVAGAAMWTFPVGQRPTYTHTFSGHLVTGASPGMCWVVVNTDGTVVVGAYLTNSTATTMRVEVDFIRSGF
ncbi:hypothetical protein [Gryllotalpicola protaetiae]|uniref:Uncharacterized protein n=1 Tax=Gryllotalpicola protaetiae TaxID=2419771 RepID=A0A387BJD8_9MICO|nr:hypothetical protein [Gryllotalpicola protaetiae]AYG02362.1 hypothetical protein D7I44_01650 [Gryllotalpicola protaetiae]